MGRMPHGILAVHEGIVTLVPHQLSIGHAVVTPVAAAASKRMPHGVLAVHARVVIFVPHQLAAGHGVMCRLRLTHTP